MNNLIKQLPNEASTEQLGKQLAEGLSAPATVYLSGPLGAGKSTLVRAFLRALGVTGSIKSPTYALVEPYKFSSYSIYHFDFYRFFDQNEWIESGFRDYFEENSVCLVEWPEKAVSVLPEADLEISLSYVLQADGQGEGSSRQVQVSANTKKGQEVVRFLTGKQEK